ncbi:MAG TPA: DUF423 domain-containing protein [Caulobacteraceae bacterium]|nr:DUF423 domain-containing protein [Caulobacteraceae bacterium]
MDKSSRLLLGLAGASGFLAVAAGAFGAHGVTDPVAKGWLETGGHYQLVHALAALVAVILARQGLQRARLSAWLFLSGALIFSGTLYLMAVGAPRWLGAVTPIGGLLLLAGWAILALAGLGKDGAPS